MVSGGNKVDTVVSIHSGTNRFWHCICVKCALSRCKNWDCPLSTTCFYCAHVSVNVGRTAQIKNPIHNLTDGDFLSAPLVSLCLKSCDSRLMSPLTSFFFHSYLIWRLLQRREAQPCLALGWCERCDGVPPSPFEIVALFRFLSTSEVFDASTFSVWKVQRNSKVQRNLTISFSSFFKNMQVCVLLIFFFLSIDEERSHTINFANCCVPLTSRDHFNIILDKDIGGGKA